jgi:chemotaxis response regulator CheB
MGTRDIVVVGASAGGIAALERLLESLPPSFPAAVFIAIHFQRANGIVPILKKRARLPIQLAIDSQPFQTGNVYVSPDENQFSIENGRIRVESSPRESAFQPSINALFRSAASAYGQRVIGVVLTGMLYDGAAGLWQIRKHGGVAIVQDPADAQYPEMPENAIRSLVVDHVLPLDKIGEALIELTQPEPGAARRALRVLIAGKEPIAAQSLGEDLKNFGYEVMTQVESGEDAIALAGEFSPDVVLLDLCLAGSMTGAEAARRIWERWQIPILYLTAHTDPATLDQLKATESYGYLVKPCHSEAVHASIQFALDRREKELRRR